MKIFLIGFILTLSTTSLFAECVHNQTGKFTSFDLESGVKTLIVNSKKITVAKESNDENIVTVEGLDGVTHFYGKDILVDFIDAENNRFQVSCGLDVKPETK